MGIETEYHSRIFDIFEQLDQEFDGSGVGLALVKRIVEKHGGRIWAESEGAGKGASFCFTLPGVLPQVTKMNGSKREEICS
jgi:signal transduction histidine kinase